MFYSSIKRVLKHFAQQNYWNPNGASQQKLHQGAAAGNKNEKRDLKPFSFTKTGAQKKCFKTLLQALKHFSCFYKTALANECNSAFGKKCFSGIIAALYQPGIRARSL